MKANFSAFLLILKAYYPNFFFRYPIHRCCRLVQRQSLAKINPKKTCFYQQQQNLSLLREFFCKTTPPKKHYYYIHTTRINKQLRKQQNKDGKNRRRRFSLSSLIQPIFLLHSGIICKFLFKNEFWYHWDMQIVIISSFKVSYNFIDFFFVRKVWTKSDDIRCNLFLHFSKKNANFLTVSTSPPP